MSNKYFLDRVESFSGTTDTEIKRSTVNASFSQRMTDLLRDHKEMSTVDESILRELRYGKENATTVELDNVYLASKDIINLKNALNENMNVLSNRRIMLYENLISAALGKFYCNVSDSSVKIAEKADSIIRTFDTSVNSEFLENLDALSRVASVKDSSVTTINGDIVTRNGNVPFTEPEINIIKRCGEYFLKTYNSIKEDADLGETDIDYSGMIGKIETLTFDTPESEISGDILFKDDKDNVLDVDNLKAEDINKINLNVIADVDILVQDGSEANPYIINTSDDFLNFYCRCSDASKHFALNNNITIKSINSIRMRSNLDGKGHTISFSGSTITTGISSKISNVVFRLLSEGNVDINIGNELSKVSFVSTSIYLPILLPIPPNINFNGRAAEDIDTFFPTKLEDVKVYAKSAKTITASLHDDDNRDFGLISGSDEDNGSYYELVLDNDKSKSLVATLGSFDEPKKTELPIENVIISRGDTIFSGELEPSADNEFIFNSPDGGTSIEFINSYKGINFKNLKYSSEEASDIEMTETLKVLSFDEIKVGNATTSATSQAMSMNALANLAAYTYFKDRYSIKFSSNTCSVIDDIIDNVAKLKTNSENAVRDANNKKTSALSSLTNVLQSYTYVESTRAANDSSYDSTYTLNLESMLSTMTSYTALLNSEYDTSALTNPFLNIKKYIEMINIETDNLIIGLVESIKRIDQVIENYHVFHNNHNSYGSKFEKMCIAVSDIIADDQLDTNNTSTFKLIVPAVRKYDKWLSDFSRYTNDGQIMMSQVYIAQELCINSLRYSISDSNIANYMLKSLVNLNMLRSCKKKLLTRMDGTILNILFLNYEESLTNDYNISISEDAPIEDISFQITNISPSLSKINNINLEDLLLNTDSDVDSISEINSIIDLNILQYILKDQSPSNTKTRVDNVLSILNTCNKNFKTLLFEYRFRRILGKIYNVAKDRSSILYAVRDVFSENSDTSKSRDLLNKYISVWTFKYYSDFAKSGSIFRFIDDKNFTSFMYNYSETRYLKEFEMRLTVKGVFTKIWDKVTDLWNGVVDFFS